jgi:hypothetical protein
VSEYTTPAAIAVTGITDTGVIGIARSLGLLFILTAIVGINATIIAISG